MRALFLSLALILAATPATAFADHKSEYAAYRQALAAGDYAKAATHGEAAWRAAETEIGDTKQTAILAFNFAELVAVREPNKAIEPYERARALSQKIDARLVAEEINAGIDYASFAARPDDVALRDALENSLTARRTKSLPATPISAYGWLLLRAFEVRQKDGGDARRFSALALADAEELGESDYPVLVRTALTYGAISLIAERKRNAASLRLARQYLHRSIALFPPQASIDSFDPMLAQAFVWLRSLELIPEAREKSGATPPDPPVRWIDHTNDTCAAVEFAHIKKPRYPAPSKNRGVIGSAMIGYEMSADRVSRSVVIGEMYGSGFGQAVVEAMKSWKAKSPVAPQCAKNKVLFANFKIL